MSEFPENDIETFRTYVLPDAATFKKIQKGLSAITTAAIQQVSPFFPFAPINQEAFQRKKICAAFITLLIDVPQALAGLQEIYDLLKQRNFAAAKDKAFPTLPGTVLTTDDIFAVLSPASLTFIEIGGTEEEPRFENHTVAGYTGPKDPELGLQEILDFNELVRDGRERIWRSGLVAAESRIGLREFNDANAIYEAMANDLNPSDDERRFLALHRAFTHIARGDELYQGTRSFSDPVLSTDETLCPADIAICHYRSAIAVVTDNGVLEANPLCEEVLRRAQARIDQLHSLLNFLGYSNTYIPSHGTFAEFHQKAVDRATQAVRVAGTFADYLKAFDVALVAAAEMKKGIADAEDQITIADAAEAQAGLRRSAAETRQASVEKTAALQEVAAWADVVGFVQKTATGAASGQVDVAGAVSFAANTAARLEELKLGVLLADFDTDIARIEEDIAAAQSRIAERQKTFLEESLAFLVDPAGSRLNLNVYLALAHAFERVAEEHLNAAIRLAFFAERRAAFEAGNPNVLQVDFTFLEQDVLGTIVSPELLLEYLGDLDDQFKRPDLTDFDFEISLKRDYPLEFFQFLQDPEGKLRFRITLYDLDKRRPGPSNQRIKTVRTTITTLGTPTGNINAVLKHRGLFLMRDKASTVLNATRLIPKGEELAELIDVLNKGDQSQATLHGVTIWKTDPVEQQITTLEDDIEEFADYGIAALWEFEMNPGENPDVAISDISDIRIQFNGAAVQGDDAIRETVRNLVADYEKELGATDLDETTAALMAKHPLLSIPFTQLKSSGHASFDGTEVFPALAERAVKAVLFQAVDAERLGVGGVQLVITNSNTPLAFDRVTLENGFSEDLSQGLPTLDPSQRFALGGVWEIDATGVDQLNPVQELVLFFVYEVASP